MSKVSKIILGTALLVIGAIFSLNALGLTDVDIFFDGWWTFIIIIPCTIDLFKKREKMGNLIGITIGVLLLLCCQGILQVSTLLRLIVPITVIMIGVKLLFNGIFGSKGNEIIKEMNENGTPLRKECAAFSNCNLNFDGETFEGIDLTSTFGSVSCDLRNAVIEKDCVIQICAIFGGIDISVGENVNVKVNSTSLFGGVSNKTPVRKDVPTIYINGTCMFGGVVIK